MLLEYQDFKLFFQLFHNLIPHVDLLNAELLKGNTDLVHINTAVPTTHTNDKVVTGLKRLKYEYKV